jgi:ribonuclease G
MKKVFLVTRGDYSDYRVCAVFSDEKLAQKYIDSFNLTYDEFKIEEQIKTLMGRKVPLPSGGYLIIEHTEAMVVIDVNSGRYAKSKEQGKKYLDEDN